MEVAAVDSNKDKKIDTSEIRKLSDAITYKENNKINDKNVAKELEKPENIQLLVSWIAKFFESPSGNNENQTNFEKMATEQKLAKNKERNLGRYENVLKFLKEKASWEQREQITGLINQIKKVFTEIDEALKKDQATADTKKQNNAAEIQWINEFKKVIIDGIKTNPKFNLEQKSAMELVFSISKNNEIENNIGNNAINTFMEQYNANNNQKLTLENLTEQIYGMSNEWKDVFATYIAQVLYTKENRTTDKWIKDLRRTNRIYELKKSGNSLTDAGKKELADLQKEENRAVLERELWVKNYKKAVFPLAFKEWQDVPLLLSQVSGAVWDRTGTEWLVSWLSVTDENDKNYSYGQENFPYSENPWKAEEVIHWLPWQNILEVWIMTTGVDVNWATINLTVGKKWESLRSIRGTNKGSKNDTPKNKYSNIDRKVIWVLPPGITFTNGTLKIDAKEYNGKPQVNVDTQSISGDEVFYTASTTGEFFKKDKDNEGVGETLSYAWYNNIGQQGLFDLGGHELSEADKINMDKQILSIEGIINQNLPDWKKLIIDISAWVDQNSYVGDAAIEKLTNEVELLKDTLKDTLKDESYAVEIISAMEDKVKWSNITDPWNKLLVQARYLTGITYMIKKIGEDGKKRKDGNYLERIQFNPKTIEKGDKRYFTFESSRTIKL